MFIDKVNDDLKHLICNVLKAKFCVLAKKDTVIVAKNLEC